ncbi:hypothetical protein JVT61DRAFT_3538 [Boletus reticuloceps]|uniref:RNase H type-1 domain-containing protein n=1 Tax=Boletus reticuloceps TaxID=495285 RepID=A0A8I2YQQ6_9AGAM|nr:hypothetical protein JVT61DRAFT_3538 [Boletus reticuloceps]
MLAIRRTFNDPQRCQDVVGHRLIFCENAQSMSTEHLLLDCWCCDRFLAYCCACTARQYHAAEAARRRNRYAPVDDNEPAPKPCHYYKVAFVDGACLGNSQEKATAGIGIAIGTNPMLMQWAIPIDDDIDPPLFAHPSVQSSLLRFMAFASSPSGKSTRGRSVTRAERRTRSRTWVPAWKSKGWRNSSGKRPKNLDLFQSLDAAVDKYEREYSVRIAFWRINRIYNELADELAGDAARGYRVEPVQFESMYPQSEDEMETD